MSRLSKDSQLQPRAKTVQDRAAELEKRLAQAATEKTDLATRHDVAFVCPADGTSGYLVGIVVRDPHTIQDKG